MRSDAYPAYEPFREEYTPEFVGRWDELINDRPGHDGDALWHYTFGVDGVGHGRSDGLPKRRC